MSPTPCGIEWEVIMAVDKLLEREGRGHQHRSRRTFCLLNQLLQTFLLLLSQNTRLPSWQQTMLDGIFQVYRLPGYHGFMAVDSSGPRMLGIYRQHYLVGLWEAFRWERLGQYN